MHLYKINKDRFGTWHSFYKLIHQDNTTATVVEVARNILGEVTENRQVRVRPTNNATSSPFHIQVYEGNYSQENGTVHYYPAVLEDYIDTLN